MCSCQGRTDSPERGFRGAGRLRLVCCLPARYSAGSRSLIRASQLCTHRLARIPACRENPGPSNVRTAPHSYLVRPCPAEATVSKKGNSAFPVPGMVAKIPEMRNALYSEEPILHSQPGAPLKQQVLYAHVQTTANFFRQPPRFPRGRHYPPGPSADR